MAKFFRRILIGFVVAASASGPLAVPLAMAEDVPDEVGDPLPAQTFPTPFFMVEMRWGNVIGEPETRDAVEMNGSITLTSGTLELVKTLHFEEGQTDAVTQVSPTSISWNSTIYGHWDGLLLRGTAPQDATVTIVVGATTITKTVSDFVRLEKDVTDLGSGRELVLSVRPVREPAVVLQAFWGRVMFPQAVFAPTQGIAKPLMTLLPSESSEGEDAEEEEATASENLVPPPSLDVNFSGDLTISGATIRFAKPIAFEREEGDVLNPPEGDKVSWTSHIRSVDLAADSRFCPILLREGVAVAPNVPCPAKRFDRDGLVLGARLSTLRDTTSFTIRFTDPSVNFSKSFTFKDLWHRKFLFEPIPVNGQPSGLGLVIQVHTLRDGILARAKGTPEVFRIENGEKHHVVSPDAFRLHGFRWEDVEEVEGEELASLPEGEDLDLPEGTPVKGHGSAVFVVSDDGLCPVASPQAFEAVGLHWEDIIPLPDATINARPKCKTIDDPGDLPDGSLVRPRGLPHVYRVDNGVLFHVPSPEVFEANHFRWDRIHEISMELANRLPKEGVVGIPEGTLIKGSGPTVYVVEEGRRRPFRSPEALLGAGFRWNHVRTMSDDAVRSVPEGASLF
jgi:hypothetical protein